MGPAPSHCMAGYQALASRLMRIRLRFCSGIRKIATRRPRAMLYQGSPYSCSVPRPGAAHPAGRVRAAGAQAELWGGISQGLPPGTGDRMALQKHPSYVCRAGCQHPGYLRSPGRPPSLPALPAARAGMHQPAADQTHASSQTGRQLPAAGCSNPACQGPAEVSAVLPASSVGRGFRQPLAQGWDAAASSLTHQGKGVS